MSNQNSSHVTRPLTAYKRLKATQAAGSITRSENTSLNKDRDLEEESSDIHGFNKRHTYTSKRKPNYYSLTNKPSTVYRAPYPS